jgi:hypothetical protein
VAEEEARKAAAVERFLLGTFTAADPFAPARDPSRDRATAAGAGGDTTFGSQPEVRTGVRAALGLLYAGLGVYDKASALLERTLEERRALYGPRHPEVADVLDALGVALAGQGRLPEAEAHLRDAVSQRREFHGMRSLATAQSLDHLATVLGRRGDAAAAVELAREAGLIRMESPRTTMLYELGGQVWTMDGAGQQRVQLTRDGTNHSPTWAPDGRILFSSAAGPAPGIFLMDPDRRTLTRITAPSTGVKDFTPAPIGPRIGFTRYFPDGTSRIFSVNPDGSDIRPLTPGPRDASFSAPTAGGRLAFVSRTPEGGRDIFLLDLGSGRITRLSHTPTLYKEGVAFSPDGSRIAFTRIDPGQLEAIFVMNGDGTGVRRLSRGGHYDYLPRWSPDGTRIGFTSGRDGSFGIFTMAADGSDVVDLSQTPLQHETLWGWVKN